MNEPFHPPLLTIYTPTYKRPTYLEKCKQSVLRQTLATLVQHLIIPDEVGVGIGGMFAAIQEHTAEIKGDYVYVLQDDDYLAGGDVVEQLFYWMGQGEPEVIMVKNIKGGYIFPLHWRDEPRYRQVDLGNFIVRRDVFTENVGQFTPDYGGDYHFIHHLWEEKYKFSWLNLIFSEAQLVGVGRTEAEIKQNGKVSKLFGTVARER